MPLGSPTPIRRLRLSRRRRRTHSRHPPLSLHVSSSWVHLAAGGHKHFHLALSLPNAGRCMGFALPPSSSPMSPAATPGVSLHATTLTDAPRGPQACRPPWLRAGDPPLIGALRPEIISCLLRLWFRKGFVFGTTTSMYQLPGYILTHVSGKGSSLACFACGTYTVCSARLLRLAGKWRVRKFDA